jgi:hypothetical protein
MSLPQILPVEDILERLQAVFPAGTPQRNYLVREMAAKAVFTAFYIDAVEGQERWLAPRHVVRMGDGQAPQQSPAHRDTYYIAMTDQIEVAAACVGPMVCRQQPRASA